MKITTVLKIGGSQARHDDLPSLCTVLNAAGKNHPLLVVPGGGNFADAVRDCAKKYPLTETSAHWMAIMALDQYGRLLGDMIPKSCLVRSLAEAAPIADEGRIPVLLPHDWLARQDPLPHSWDVTSDSIAAWIAGQAMAERLILVKDVNGLYDTSPDAKTAKLLREVNAGGLPTTGGVDRYLTEVLKETACETWVVNGCFPKRIAQLVKTGTTCGTRIARD